MDFLKRAAGPPLIIAVITLTVMVLGFFGWRAWNGPPMPSLENAIAEMKTGKHGGMQPPGTPQVR